MNIYIVLGVVLIAAGTVLMTYGGSRVAEKQAKESTAATEEQFGELSKKVELLLKTPPSERPPGAIKELENEYQKWVKSFQKTRKEKLLDFQKRTLEIEESAVEVSKI